jgi:hypothetical protein
MTVPKRPAVPSNPPSTANTPAAPQPPIPPSDVIAGVQPETPPNGANVADLIRYAIAEEERFKRLQRLIWNVTGLGALVLGTASATAIIAYPHLAAGKIGLAAATVAAGGLVTKAWRWIRLRLSWPGNKAGGK